MDPVINACLAVAFVGVGAVATVLMLYVRGRPPGQVGPELKPKSSRAESQKAPEPRNTAAEPAVELIHALAREGLEGIGHHGPMAA
ncbi:MAG: hypothetical protein ACYTG0_33980, partial [Planctomycetota bacterium]